MLGIQEAVDSKGLRLFYYYVKLVQQLAQCCNKQGLGLGSVNSSVI